MYKSIIKHSMLASQHVCYKNTQCVHLTNRQQYKELLYNMPWIVILGLKKNTCVSTNPTNPTF